MMHNISILHEIPHGGLNMSLSHNGARLALSDEESVAVYSYPELELQDTFEVENAGFIAWMDSDTELFIIDGDNCIFKWDGNLQLFSEFSDLITNPIYNGEKLLVECGSGGIWSYDTEEDMIETYDPIEPVGSVIISSDRDSTLVLEIHGLLSPKYSLVTLDAELNVIRKCTLKVPRRTYIAAGSFMQYGNGVIFCGKNDIFIADCDGNVRKAGTLPKNCKEEAVFKTVQSSSYLAMISGYDVNYWISIFRKRDLALVADIECITDYEGSVMNGPVSCMFVSDSEFLFGTNTTTTLCRVDEQG